MASGPYFWAIFGPFGPVCDFWPFWALFDPFWPFGCGAKAPSGSGTPTVGVKWGGESKLVGPEGRPYLGAIFGHCEPVLALLGLFWLFGHLGGGQWLQVGPEPP